MVRRVLHLIDTGGPGGAETIFANVVTGLPKAEWESTAVLPERDWLARHLEQLGVQPLLVPTRGSFDVRYLGRLMGLVRRCRIDVIHAHLLTTSVYGSLAAWLSDIPVVCTFHGMVDVGSRDRHVRMKFRILKRKRNRLVFVSESLRQHFMAVTQLDSRNTRVVYNGIDATQFQPGRQDAIKQRLTRAGEVLIGAVGNVRAPKAYGNLLHAAALLKLRGHAFRVVIAGDARGALHAELLVLRAQLGLDGHVEFLGFREDVQDLLRAFDIYVLSSAAEGFSLTTVQAMASGLPVVATRCGGPEEIIRDDLNGILVPPNDSRALADALERLILRPEERLRLAGAARSDAEARFSHRVMVAGYEGIYRELLDVPEPPVARATIPHGAHQTTAA